MPDRPSLPAGTAMGPVGLRVLDQAAALAFYRDAIGLPVLRQSPTEAALGGASGPLLVLETAPDARRPARGGAGLYHVALRYPGPAALAGALGRVLRRAPGSYRGAGDHGVSEAFYFSDPEGNGLELYVDRPRERWTWVDGRVRMDTAPLDPGAFLSRHGAPGDVADDPTDVNVGHVHLRVGDLAASRRFYVDAVGFAVTADLPGALFVSAGGYHHHLGANTWRSAGAAARRGDEAGLAWLTVTVPDPAHVTAAARRLEHAGVGWRAAAAGIVADDPWGNEVAIVADGR